MSATYDEFFVPGALSESDARNIADVLHDAVTGMALIGPDCCFHMVNPAMCQILGRSREDLLGTPTADVTHPDDRKLADAKMRELLSGQLSTDQSEKRYIRPDGSVVQVIRTTTVLRDRRGRPAGLFTQVVDMTEMARAQESLRRSESRFRAMVAHASDATILLDASGRITYASPASLRLLGHSPEELEGHVALEYIHPHDVVRARTAFIGLVRSKRPRASLEYRVRHSLKGWRTVEVVLTNLLDDPSVGALVLNARDLTDQRQFQDQLSASERRFRALVGTAWDILTVHDSGGRYLYCSPAVTAQLGYRPVELVGTDLFRSIHADDVGAMAEFWQAAGELAEGRVVQYRFAHKDGSWRWLESTVQNRLDDPAIGGMVVTTRDVTARRRRSAQQNAIATLSSSALRGRPIERLYAHAVELVAATVEAEHCAVVSDAGDGSVRLEAFASELMSDAPVRKGSQARPSVLTARALREGSTIAWTAKSPDPGLGPRVVAAGVRSGVAAVISPGTGERGALAVYSRSAGAFSEDDVSFLEAAANVLAAAVTRSRIERELRQQALHDSLTGLPNRILLLDRLSTAMSRLARHHEQVATMFIDLDNFKFVNDTLGHPVGDDVVATVAERIVSVVRSSDTVARFGGDEFVVLCDDTDSAAATELADRIRRSVAQPMDLAGRRLTITASVGIAVTEDPATTPDELLAMADMAMYAAKESGKDCSSHFALPMRATATRRLDSASGIRRGLDLQEFRLMYQPIVDARTGSPIGTEALVRWQHPTEGLLGPEQFIADAEASGLMIPLGEWVLRTACAQSADWKRSGQVDHVSINISGLQLSDGDIVATVARAIDETGARPGHIHLELTENAVMSDLHRASLAMEGLRGLGVLVGMDDFGTGHSSLSQLARLPFDFVKIDRSFVQHFDDHRTSALLKTIATLCQALQLPAVAEGVETDEQLGFLRELGIPFIQGFLFGRPQPAEAFSSVAGPAFRGGAD